MEADHYLILESTLQVMPKLREEDPQASRLRSKISGCLEEVAKGLNMIGHASKCLQRHGKHEKR